MRVTMKVLNSYKICLSKKTGSLCGFYKFLNVLFEIAQQVNLSNEQLKEIVLHILKFGEGERDWWLEYLEINTGLDNLTDYIFYPDLIGLDFDATLEQIADKIIADRK